jgi:hypothetical protein
MFLAFESATASVAVIHAYDLSRFDAFVDGGRGPLLFALFSSETLKALDAPEGSFPPDPYGQPLAALGLTAYAVDPDGRAPQGPISALEMDAGLAAAGVPSACFVEGGCLDSAKVCGPCAPSAPPAAPAPPASPDFSAAPSSWARTATFTATIALPWPAAIPPPCGPLARASLDPGADPCPAVGSACPPPGTYPSGFLSPGDTRRLVYVDPAGTCAGPHDGSLACPFARLSEALAATASSAAVAIAIKAGAYAEPAPLELMGDFVIRGACPGGSRIATDVVVASGARLDIGDLEIDGALTALAASSSTLTGMVIVPQARTATAIVARGAHLAASDLLIESTAGSIDAEDTTLFVSDAELRGGAHGLTVLTSPGLAATASVSGVLVNGGSVVLGGGNAPGASGGRLTASVERTFLLAMVPAPRQVTIPPALLVGDGADASFSDLWIHVYQNDALHVAGGRVRAERLVALVEGPPGVVGANVTAGALDLSDAVLFAATGMALSEGGALDARRILTRSNPGASLSAAAKLSDVDFELVPLELLSPGLVVDGGTGIQVVRARLRGRQAALICRARKSPNVTIEAQDLTVAASGNQDSLQLADGCALDAQRIALLGGKGADVGPGASFHASDLVVSGSTQDGLDAEGGSELVLDHFEITECQSAGLHDDHGQVTLSHGRIASNDAALLVESGTPGGPWFEDRGAVVLEGNRCADPTCGAYPPVVRFSALP